MSAMTVLVPQAHRSVDRPRSTPTSTWPCTIVHETTAPSEWRLTDRGVAVVMVIALMILTAALLVIGLTAIRVTSADYGADAQESRHSRH
jgi:hypothetical protein